MFASTTTQAPPPNRLSTTQYDTSKPRSDDFDNDDDDTFENLSKIASTHAATRIRDATIRLLSIWFENISAKMLDALDIPSKHLERFQKNPNEEALTSFMDSFIAAREIVQEQLMEMHDSDDKDDAGTNNNTVSRVGPRGNPFEINNRLFGLFVQTISDAIASMKVAMTEESDKDDKHNENSNTNANQHNSLHGGKGGGDKHGRDQRASSENVWAGNTPAHGTPHQTVFGIADTNSFHNNSNNNSSKNTTAHPPSHFATTQNPQREGPQQNNLNMNTNAYPTPNREWRQLSCDDGTPKQPVVEKEQERGRGGYTSSNYSKENGENESYERMSVGNAEDQRKRRMSEASSNSTHEHQRDVASYLIAQRQKKFGVAGKVGIGGERGEQDGSVMLPSSRASSCGRAPSSSESFTRPAPDFGRGGVPLTPRMGAAAHSSASKHNNIFGNEGNVSQAPRVSSRAHVPLSSGGGGGGRAHENLNNLEKRNNATAYAVTPPYAQPTLHSDGGGVENNTHAVSSTRNHKNYGNDIFGVREGGAAGQQNHRETPNTPASATNISRRAGTNSSNSSSQVAALFVGDNGHSSYNKERIDMDLPQHRSGESASRPPTPRANTNNTSLSPNSNHHHHDQPQKTASATTPRLGVVVGGSTGIGGVIETPRQSQLRHEIQLLEAQISAARNAHGSSSEIGSAKVYAINKKMNVLKADLLKETREANELLSIRREREAQKAAVEERRRMFHR